MLSAACVLSEGLEQQAKTFRHFYTDDTHGHGLISSLFPDDENTESDEQRGDDSQPCPSGNEKQQDERPGRNGRDADDPPHAVFLARIALPAYRAAFPRIQGVHFLSLIPMQRYRAVCGKEKPLS